MTELNPIAAAIHSAICDDTPEECAEYDGQCIKAADALPVALRGWVIPDGSVLDLVCETCNPDVRLDDHRVAVGELVFAAATHKHTEPERH